MISLSIEKQTNYTEGKTQSFTVTMEVTENSLGDREVFMIYCRDNREFFSHIASPVDMVEYGTDKLVDVEGYYRVSKVQLILRCEADADEVIKFAKIDIDEFNRSNKNALLTAPSEIVRYE
jgi:hypothetical protein